MHSSYDGDFFHFSRSRYGMTRRSLLFLWHFCVVVVELSFSPRGTSVVTSWRPPLRFPSRDCFCLLKTNKLPTIPEIAGKGYGDTLLYPRLFNHFLGARRRQEDSQDATPSRLESIHSKSRPDDGYTRDWVMEYSVNFQRYLVFSTDLPGPVNPDTSSHHHRSDSIPSVRKRKFWGSFAWLDQAQAAYPQARLQPLPLWRARLQSGPPKISPTHTTPPSAPNPSDSSVTLPMFVAGAGVDDISQQRHEGTHQAPLAYPVNDRSVFPVKVNHQDNYYEKQLSLLRSYWQDRLGWTSPGPMDSWLPHLLLTLPEGATRRRGANSPHDDYDEMNAQRIMIDPLLVWRERLEFFLAPLPPSLKVSADTKQDRIKSSLNNTSSSWSDQIQQDWSILFYQHGYGPGLTREQLSRALPIVAHLLLRCIPFTSSALTDGHLPAPLTQPQQSPLSVSCLQILAYLYDQTPPVVMDMARQQLGPWLTGTDSLLEQASMAYLHWHGWEWYQCQILLQALPSMLQVVATSSSSNGSGGKPPRRRTSPRTAGATSSQVTTHPWGLVMDPRLSTAFWPLQYLQLRLQLRPWQIKAMCKTHRTLPHYSLGKIQAILNYLQVRLELSSAETARLAMLMPSLLGCATSSLESRLDQFWLHTDYMALNLTQFRQAWLKFPALLQYNLPDNLLPKYEFFRRDLLMSHEDMVRMTVMHPQVWGQSLEQKMRPTAECFCAWFHYEANDRGRESMEALKRSYSAPALVVSSATWGCLVSHSPDLLLCNWSSNIQVKLDFLSNELGMSRTEVASFLLAVPRTLLQSLTASWKRKIAVLEQATARRRLPKAKASDRDGVRNLIKSNPSLLMVSVDALKKRTDRLMYSNFDLVDGLSPRRSRIKVGAGQDNDTSVEHSERQRQKVNIGNFVSLTSAVTALGGATNGPTEFEAGEEVVHLLPSDRIRSESINIDWEQTAGGHGDNTTDADGSLNRLIIRAVGVAFPRQDSIRGRRRAGGMAIQVPGWTMEHWRKLCPLLWKGRKFRLQSDQHTLILGYPYTRPSRQRCSLYACHEALRVANRWAAELCHTGRVEIEIETDSNYVIQLLSVSERIVEWGSTEPGVGSDGWPTTSYSANPDILYPLSRTYCRLIHQSSHQPDQQDSVDGKIVLVQFKPTALDTQLRDLRRGALDAAQLMYKTI